MYYWNKDFKLIELAIINLEKYLSKAKALMISNNNHQEMSEKSVSFDFISQNWGCYHFKSKI